uniref:Uncharacterized protein n=1 Tax=Spongospora subterranea TaxID=70186 RepID=A0A0H5QJX4_9EUKA|eukprot:CRZ01641.1 hypothetical protein [Spongospora subterranea]
MATLFCCVEADLFAISLLDLFGVNDYRESYLFRKLEGGDRAGGHRMPTVYEISVLSIKMQSCRQCWGSGFPMPFGAYTDYELIILTKSWLIKRIVLRESGKVVFTLNPICSNAGVRNARPSAITRARIYRTCF